MADIFDEVLSERTNAPKGDIFDQVLLERQKQGGEQNAQNQPKTNSDRNAGREGNQQIQPSNEGGIQANGEPSSLYLGDQRKAPGQITGETNEGLQKNETYGTQAKKEGQGIRGQVPTGNQEEVKPQETGVQSAFSKVRDFGAEALSSIGQGIYGSLSAIARTEPEYIELPSYGTKVKNPRYQESKDLVDFFERQKAGAVDVEALGAKPITGIAKTAADVTGGLLKIPAQIATGPLGMASMIGEAFGSHKDAVYQKAKQQGMSDEDALNKANFEATASTAATLPLYYVGGKVAGVAADKLVSEAAPQLAKAATRFGLNAVANSVASSASRGVTAALAGENIADAMKDVNVPGLIQDIAFAAQSTATHFQEQVTKGNGKEAARDLPDHALEQFAQDPNYADVVAPEVKARAESRMAQEAEKTNLPETAKALKVSSEVDRVTAPEPPRFEESPSKTITLEPIKPEAPPLAPTEAAPSLPKEEAKPPVSVAGETPAVEPTAEVDMVPTPGILPGGKEPPTMAPKAEYEKGVAELQKLRGDEKISLIDYQRVHSDVAQGVDPIEAAQRAENKYQAHKYAGSETSRAVSSGEIPSGPKAADIYEQKYNERLNELKPAKAPAKAQPTKPSEEQVKETSGLPTLERVTPVSETAVKAEEGVAQREGEGEGGQVTPLADGSAKPEAVAIPEGARVAAAAYLAPDGNIYEGPDHLAAMGKAKDAGVISQADIDAKQAPESRNTSDYGFKVTLPDGTSQDTTREIGGQVAKKSNQALVDKFVHGDKAHSNEIRFDNYDENGKQQVPPHLWNDNPAEATKQYFDLNLNSSVKDEGVRAEIRDSLKDPNKPLSPTAMMQFNRLLQNLGLARDDAKALGVMPKGSKETQFVLESAGDYTKWMADAIFKNIKMPYIKAAGLWEKAFEHGGARDSVPHLVEGLTAKVFPDSYKNKVEMNKTGRILMLDDILGGYEAAKQDRDILRASEKKGSKKLEDAELRVANIEAAHDIPSMESEVQAAKGTKIEENINRWTQFVVPEMDRMFNILAGVDENTPRENRGKYFGSRVNLLPKSEEERISSYGDISKPRPMVGVSNHKNPTVKTDPFRKVAKLTGDYSEDPTLMLTNSLASRVNEATKMSLYKAIEEKGVGFIGKQGEEMPETIDGKKTARIAVKVPETDPETGKTKMVERNLFVQEQLKPELIRLIDVDSRPTMNPFFKALTSLQVATGVDAVSHLTNQFGKTYQILSDLSGVAKNSIPLYNFLKSGKTIVDITKEVTSDSPKIREEKAQLAKMGVLRPHHPNDSIVERVLGTHELLYKTDVAVRIFANRAFNQLVKEGKATNRIDERIKYVSDLGNYNRRMMGEWEQRLRDKGFAPFVVAGRAFIQTGLKAATFTPGYEAPTLKGKLMARASLMAAFAGTNALIATVNMMTTGKPTGRDGTPLGVIDFGPNLDTKDGKRRGLDMWKMSLVRRGLRAVGANAVIEGVRNGADPNDIFTQATNEMATSWSHPFIGPGVGFVAMVGTGKRIDLRSGYAERYQVRKVGGPKQLAENLRVALKQQVPPFYEALKPAIQTTMEEGFGIPRPAEERIESLEAPSTTRGKVASYIGKTLLKGIVEPVSGAIGVKAMGTPAETLASELGTGVQFTPEEDNRYAYRKAYLDLKKENKNQDATNILRQGVKDGFIKEADFKSIERSLKNPEKIIAKVGMLKDANSATRVFKVANSNEQDLIFEEVSKKIEGSTTLDPDQKANLMKSVLESAKKGSFLFSFASKFPKDSLQKVANGLINKDLVSLKEAISAAKNKK